MTITARLKDVHIVQDLTTSEAFTIRYSNRELLLLKFFKHNLKINAEMIFLSRKSTKEMLVFVKETQWRNSLKRWNSYTRSHIYSQTLNPTFIKYSDQFNRQIMNLFPNVKIKDMKFIHDKIKKMIHIIIFIPRNQIKFAIGKKGKHINLCNDFITECAPHYDILADPI